LKRELGVVTTPSFMIDDIGVEVQGSDARNSRYSRHPQQQRFIRNQRGMTLITFRMLGCLMCMFVMLLIVFLIVANSHR
jgi:hypothetical protein